MRVSAKKMSSWVRPGVCEVRARLLRPASALIRLDLPTLERPAKAISISCMGGSAASEPAAATKRHSPANSFRPASSSSSVKASIPSRRAPCLGRGVDPEMGLGDPVPDVHGVAADAAGEAALRAQAQLLDGRVAARLLDAPLERVLGLALRALGGDEAEHRHL